MGEVLDFEKLGPNSPLAAHLKADLEFNQKIAKKLEEFWASMGHIIKFEVSFIPRLNVHKVSTKDLKNGLPFKEPLTHICRKRLTQLPK